VSPQAPNLAGKTIGRRYRLMRVLGEGGFGTVYEAVDERLDRRVAVKVIKPWWAEDAEWTGRFEQEAKLAASLNHRGIVQVHDTGRDGRVGLYIVCELVDGESLADRARRGQVSPQEAARIGADILDALQAAHDRGIIHRDIKPQNVLLSAEGAAKLADFGVARLSGGMTHSSASATVIGTPVYMSPEQARGRTVKATADVYSVGVMLYELLAGQPPFTGENHVELAMKHVSDPPPPLPATVPVGMRDAVMRALAKEPAERFRSAADMASALRKANAQPAGGPTPNPTDAPTERLEEPTTAAVGEQATRRWARTRRQPRAASPAAEAQSRARRPIVIAVAALVALAVGLAVTQPWAGKGDRNNPVSSADAAKATASTDGSGPSSHADGAPADPGPPERTVPTLRGLAVSGARARARHHHLVMAVHRHASRRVGDGLVISQTPVPGELVSDGATVAVNVSTGPPPVSVPDVSGDSSAYAARQLSVAGLTSSTTSTSSSKPAGTVLSQSPDAGDEVAPGTSVQLTVAAPKAWHTVDTFTADGESSSDIFRIRGSRWRLTYTLTFSHCDFSCYPPSIYIHNKAGTDFRNFSLKDGTHTTSVPMPPGHYYVEVTSVSQDDFTVDVKVEDYA